MKEKGYYKEYYQENKEKFKDYRYNHMHKKHDITENEWELCKEYFNFSCAYCGMDEEIAKELYDQRLHKEHAINDGDGDISNCIPSCRKCNSEKWKRDLNEWYTSKNPVYSLERLNRINKWLQLDCFKYCE